MTAPRHTLVVGGGIVGLGIAWQLARRGARVTVLERGEPGREASWAAAGMLAPYAELEFHEDALLALGERSQALWPAFVEALEADAGHDVGYDTTGTLLVAVDRDDAEALDRVYRYQRDRGLPVERLDGDGCRALEPLLAPSLYSGVLCRADHQVDNRRTLDALVRALDARGGSLRTGADVAAVRASAGQIHGVTLADGEPIDADAVVVAAGAWSRGLDGLDGRRPPVRPVKGQMAAIRCAPDERVLRHVVRTPDTYLVPRRDGRIIIGATSEERGFDRTQTAGGVYELLRGAYEVLPISWELALDSTWVGFRPGSRDNNPLLGETDVAGLWYATGHYRNGIQLAPVTAFGLAGALLGDAPEAVLAPMSPRRFLRSSRTSS